MVGVNCPPDVQVMISLEQCTSNTASPKFRNSFSSQRLLQGQNLFQLGRLFVLTKDFEVSECSTNEI